MTESAYTAPESLAEVVAALQAGARIVAGGTDLVVGARQGKGELPNHLVAIHRVAALEGMSTSDGGVLRLGALVRHEELVTDALINERFTALADAAAIVGSPATRWAGTIGGNVMNASPAADTCGPLLCFDGVAELVSHGGTRKVSLDELFSGPGQTTARADELLTAVELQAPAAGGGSCYARLEYRRQMEIAVVGATVVVSLDGGRVTDARVAITAVTPTIRRVPEAERILVGSDGGRDAAVDAATAAAEAADSIDDVRATATYRRAMVAVICRRVIQAAVARASGEVITIPASDALVGAG